MHCWPWWIHDSSKAGGERRSKIRVTRQSCFICHQLTCKTTNKQWECCKCGMPLYQVDRSDGITQRPYLCIDEHLSSQDKNIGCNKNKRNSFILPDHLKNYSMTRQQEQLCKQDKQRKRREQQGQNGSQTSVPLRNNTGEMQVENMKGRGWMRQGQHKVILQRGHKGLWLRMLHRRCSRKGRGSGVSVTLQIGCRG